MFAITWSSWHICFAALCATFLEPLVCGLNLRPSSYKNQPLLLADCWALFTLWHICVVKLGVWSYIRWPWFVAYSIPLCYSNFGQAFNFGNTVWVVSLDECSWGHGVLHPEAERLQALPLQMLFIYLKAYHKAGRRAGILFFCQSLTDSDNIAQCTPWRFLPNHPFFWECLSIALFCSYWSRWSDIP